MAHLALLVDGVVVNKFELHQSCTTIGRADENDITIDDLAVSSRHAKIEARDTGYLSMMEYSITDLGSTNHTFINNQQISSKTILSNGDLIRIGYNQFKFVDEQQVNHAETAIILPDD